MTRIIFFILVFVMSVSTMTGQDIHFSQFYTSPLNLNPAMTGLHNCKTRAIVNYRNQWAGAVGANAYNTFSASYDVRRPTGKNNYFGYGATLWGDVAGESNYGLSAIKLSGSYSMKMLGSRRGGGSYLVFGAEGAFAQRRISTQDLRWPNQYKNGLFDASIPSGETELIKDVLFYPDISVGAVWFTTVNHNFSWYVGFAGHHINTPNISFLNNKTAQLSAKFTAHAGLEYPIADDMNIVPYVVYMKQGAHWQTTAGSSVRFKMGRNRYSTESWQVGLWYRLANKTNTSIQSDAIILSSKINLEKLTFGFSYDATISKLRNAGTAVGAFEVSMQYKICGNFNRGVYCPQF